MQDNNQNKSGLSWSAPKPEAPSPLMPAAPSAAAPKPAEPASRLAPATGTQMPVYMALLVGGILVGVLLAWGWSALKESGSPGSMATSTPRTNNDSTANADSGLGSPNLSLIVPDQAAGSQVTVTRASMQKPTWVVVYLSRAGKPGNALGARLFFPESPSGTVALLRDTQPGQTYFVGESLDNGDRIFSLSADEQVKGDNGEVLWTTFKAR